MKTVVMKFKYIMSASMTGLRLYFHKGSVNYRHTFFTFAWDAVCWLH